MCSVAMAVSPEGILDGDMLSDIAAQYRVCREEMDDWLLGLRPAAKSKVWKTTHASLFVWEYAGQGG